MDGAEPRPQHPNQFFHSQEPGPSGLPHDPQGPADIAGATLPLADTANTESLGSSFLLSHFGHAALSLPKTRASNSCWHSLQTYSKMGMKKLREENCCLLFKIKAWVLRKHIKRRVPSWHVA